MAIHLSAGEGDLRDFLRKKPIANPEFYAQSLVILAVAQEARGERLFLSTATVKRHAHSIYEKLNVTGRREAVTKAVGLGLIAD